MGTPDPRRIIQGYEGSLCYGATDVTTAYPHGGTGLGECRDMQFRFGEQSALVRAEEFSNVVVEGFRWQESPLMVAVLRQWDDDALAAVFPDTTTGDSGRAVLRGHTSINDRRAGRKLSDFAIKLVFSPKALDTTPFVVIYNAIPVLMDAVMDARLDREVGIGVGFYGIPDSDGKLWEVAMRGDLTL